MSEKWGKEDARNGEREKGELSKPRNLLVRGVEVPMMRF